MGSYGNIRNFLSYFRSLPDWSHVNSSFDKGARVSDVDGIIDISGHVIFGEMKEAGTRVNGGQSRLHRSLLSPKSLDVHLLFVEIEENGDCTCPLCDGLGVIPNFIKHLVKVVSIGRSVSANFNWSNYAEWLQKWCEEKRK